VPGQEARSRSALPLLGEPGRLGFAPGQGAGRWPHCPGLSLGRSCVPGSLWALPCGSLGSALPCTGYPSTAACVGAGGRCGAAVTALRRTVSGQASSPVGWSYGFVLSEKRDLTRFEFKHVMNSIRQNKPNYKTHVC